MIIDKTDLVAMIGILVAMALIVFGPVVFAQDTLGGADIDGISLTDEEVSRYNAMVKQKARTMGSTKQFAEQVLRWISTVAPAAIENSGASEAAKTNMRDRATQMHGDFKTLAKLHLEQMGATEVTGITIRTITLQNEVNVAGAIRDRAQNRLDEITNDPGGPVQADIDAATTVRDAAQADVDAAQTELDEWIIAHTPAQ